MRSGMAACSESLSVIAPTARRGPNRLRNFKSDPGRCSAVTSQPAAISCRTKLRPTNPVPPVTNAARDILSRVRRVARVGVVPQMGREPALGLGKSPPLALRVARHLIAVDLADAEVVSRRMREIKPADRCGREHRKGFGQADACVRFRVEQPPQRCLFRVLGTGGISRGGANPLILFADQFGAVELFRASLTPQFA